MRLIAILLVEVLVFGVMGMGSVGREALASMVYMEEEQEDGGGYRDPAGLEEGQGGQEEAIEEREALEEMVNRQEVGLDEEILDRIGEEEEKEGVIEEREADGRWRVGFDGKGGSANYEEIVGKEWGMAFENLRYWEGPGGGVGYGEAGERVWVGTADGGAFTLERLSIASGWDAETGGAVAFTAYDREGGVIGTHEAVTEASDFGFSVVDFGGIAGFERAHRVSMVMVSGSEAEGVLHVDDMVIDTRGREYSVEVTVKVATDYYVKAGVDLTEEEALGFYEPAEVYVLVDGEEVGRDIVGGAVYRDRHTYETDGGTWSEFRYRIGREVKPEMVTVRVANDYYIRDENGVGVADRNVTVESLEVNGKVLDSWEHARVFYGEYESGGRNRIAATSGEMRFEMGGHSEVFVGEISAEEVGVEVEEEEEEEEEEVEDAEKRERVDVAWERVWEGIRGYEAVLTGSDGEDIFLVTGDRGISGSEVFGGGGEDIFFSVRRGERLRGWEGNVFTGGEGADIYVMSRSRHVRDEIRDFGGGDTIDLRGFSREDVGRPLYGFGDLDIREGERGVEIYLGEGQWLVLGGVKKEDLGAEDFIFNERDRVSGWKRSEALFPDMEVGVGEAFSYTFQEGMEIEHVRENGSSLPLWLYYDAESRTLSGIASAVDKGITSIRVEGKEEGSAVMTIFEIAVVSESGLEMEIVEATVAWKGTDKNEVIW
ncbi:MAG: hypothetical protein GY766_20300, partial [Herbaspirillum sp.]|uniref:carbohydrate-binding domain-containing protein n=1 Tax=Herbaspirillum sp. TaxID=1890675 RepID=UPI00258544CF